MFDIHNFPRDTCTTPENSPASLGWQSWRFSQMSLNPVQPRDDRTAVDKAMSLLNAFGQDSVGGVGVSELARRADLSKSTAFRLLGMLQRNGAVERAGNAYRLGKM